MVDILQNEGALYLGLAGHPSRVARTDSWAS